MDAMQVAQDELSQAFAQYSAALDRYNAAMKAVCEESAKRTDDFVRALNDLAKSQSREMRA